MKRSLVILRPIDSARETENRAEKLGLSVIADPLFIIEPMEWTAPPAGQFDALMLTSANAVKYGGDMLSQYVQLPVLAVGDATAMAARQAGFTVTDIGNGGAEDLLQSLGPDRYPRILRLTGKDHVKTAASPQKLTLRRVYQAAALPLGESAQTALQQGHVVLLYSVRAAKILNDEMDRLQLERSNNDIVALSPAIAEAAGSRWKSVQAAEQPTDDALLSLAGRLCLP
ncbi:uroporphyrinogen-III synthase [Parasphingorhabdus cellanae]|uniref:Uroporphyrinogen-III synthase n=1 Tax=Parasphingorhabdus cellanae TaxID=2806553 RepID=A0ABX7T1S3_9SPHN|nr:uroporphyrinogen-III synthase [Parasphingorhabdus cellanae]QTD54479.1 uroporphyrinogen-III synthase [Parasphingorhabdus cellanae]